MNDHIFHRREPSRKTAGLWPQLLIGAIGIGTVLAGLPAQASESQTLWECSSYTGDAHTRCLETFAESQRDQIATLKESCKAQQEAVNHLKISSIVRHPRVPICNVNWHNHPPSCRAVPPLYAYPLWDSASTWVALGSTGRHIITARTFTAHATMDHATVATVGNEVLPRIIHEHFCCNHRSAPLWLGIIVLSPTAISHTLHKFKPCDIKSVVVTHKE